MAEPESKKPAEIERCLDIAGLCICWKLVAGARSVLERDAEYAKQVKLVAGARTPLELLFNAYDIGNPEKRLRAKDFEITEAPEWPAP